jgi:hypothetical protein
MHAPHVETVLCANGESIGSVAVGTEECRATTLDSARADNDSEQPFVSIHFPAPHSAKDFIMRILLITGLMLVGAAAGHASDKELFAIAHMANTRAAVDSAVAHGANAVEIDLKFDDQGQPTVFHHGRPCDCLCAPGSNSICAALALRNGRRYACEASEKPKPLLNHVATKSRVALAVIDSKVGELQETAQIHGGPCGRSADRGPSLEAGSPETSSSAQRN